MMDVKINYIRKIVRNILKEEFWDPSGGLQKQINSSQEVMKKLIAAKQSNDILAAIGNLYGRDDKERYAKQASDKWGSSERAVIALTRQLTPAEVNKLISYFR